MKILTILGARPQFIKAAAFSAALTESNKEASNGAVLIEEKILHTGQHYDFELSKQIFTQLDIPSPYLNLGIRSMNHGQMTGEMIIMIEKEIQQENPDWVLVYGDTNSTLAGAVSAAKLHVPVCHVEAGLRSFDKRMPEEINRVLTDHLSKLLKANLLVIDDIMMFALEKKQAVQLFNFINHLHERASFIVTTNKSPQEWVKMLDDEVIATALLDRILYHCEVVRLSGKSYRLENRKTIFN